MSAMNHIIASTNRKIWPLIGGVHPAENKTQSTQCAISTPPVPSTLVLPMSQHAGRDAAPIVAVGDRVLKGQMIARATGFVSAPVHAPTSGVITAIEPRPVPHPSGLMELCIVLESDGEDRWCELTTVDDYRKETPESLLKKAHDAGISGMGGAGFPTSIKLGTHCPIDTLILNGAECEPYITADDMLMREQADDIVLGAEIIQYIVGAKHCLIGIEDNKPEAADAMRKATVGKNMEVVVIPTAYPSGGSKQLIQILTGKEVPSGTRTAELGMIMQNVATAAAVKEAVIDGRPQIDRIITLTGDALSQPQNVEALIGTTMDVLLDHAGLQESDLSTLVLGGPMMGFKVERLDTPVIKTTNCLIAATAEEFPPAPDAQACIRCGHCADACPSSLLPQQLYWHAKAENHDQLMHHNLFDCIECGACAFVCPSSIPLVQYYRASKGAIRTQKAKHAKAERSKVRYESRLARLEQEKAAKEAKRKANAERAAKLKAAKATADTTPAAGAKAEDDPIQAAIARAKARKAATAADKTTAPAKTALTSEQKELKIQLSMAKARLKKTERALAAAEASGTGDIEQLQSNLASLKEQVEKLQKDFDQSSQSEPFSSKPAKPKPPRATLSAEEKKHKVELAMAKAALKKAERALAEALEHDNEHTESSKQAVEECKSKLATLEAASKPTPQPAHDSKSTSTKSTSAKTPKPTLSDEAKKLKIETAMTNAAVKKLKRAIANAGDDEQAGLQQQLAEAEQKAADMKKALEQVS